MKSTKQLLVWMILAISVIELSAVVYAALTAPGLNPRPTDGTVLTSATVNFSGRINNTNDGNTTFRLQIMNSSTKSGNYSVLIDFVVPNASKSATETFWNISNRTLRDGIRHYWFFNFTNATTNGLTTSIRTFNIDANYYKLTFGSQGNINFSLDTGDINTSGVIRARNLSLMDTTGSIRTCYVNSSVQFVCI